jgi:hypothetical protein
MTGEAVKILGSAQVLFATAQILVSPFGFFQLPSAWERGYCA